MSSVARASKSWALHCLPVSGLVGGLGGLLLEPQGWARAWWFASLVALGGAVAGAVPILRYRSRGANPAGLIPAVGWAIGLRAGLTIVGAVGLVLGGHDRLAVGLGVAANYAALLVLETRWALRVLRQEAPPGFAGASSSVAREQDPRVGGKV